MKKTFTTVFALSAITLFFLQAAAANVVQPTPATFDFGWCPDNAKITCEYTLKNTGEEPVSLKQLRPACGCTAAQFSPQDLGSNEDTKIGMEFNTRGYAGVKFNKTAIVETGRPETNLTIALTGHVVDPKAKVVPVGDGIAGFTPGGKSKQTITIANNTDQDVTLEIVQPAAEWASAKLKSDTIKAGQTTDLQISVDSPLEETKTTSVTLEALAGVTPHRLTVAIRTGPPPAPIRRPTPPQRKSPPPPLKDPMKLQGIEPRTNNP